MTTQPSRVHAGIPTGGQFASKTQSDDVVTLADPRAERRAAYNRFQLETDSRILKLKGEVNHAQLRNFVDALRQDHPEAKTFELYVDDDGDILANYVRDADGNELEEATADLNESLHEADPDEMQALGSVPHDIDEMLAWEPEGGLVQDPSDPFAHLTGVDKARAQGELAQKLNDAAAKAYAEDVRAKVLAAAPTAASVFFDRHTDSVEGASFTMARVEDADGNPLDVDLAGIEDHMFQDRFLDDQLEFVEDEDEFYLAL